MEYLENIKQTLQTYPEIDGIFASSDVIAAQSIQACSALGKRVPEDVQIVGFDDVNIATLVNPMLTTIRQPIKEMAQLAVDAILKKRGGGVMPAKVVLPVSLMKRGTTKEKLQIDRNDKYIIEKTIVLSSCPSVDMNLELFFRGIKRINWLTLVHTAQKT